MLSHYFIALGSSPQRLTQQEAAGTKTSMLIGSHLPPPRHRSWEGTDTGMLYPVHAKQGRCLDVYQAFEAVLATARESGMRMINPTIATTITMTTTFGSLKLWLPTTSAAAMLRWAVASASTVRVSLAGTSKQPTDAESKRDEQKRPRECRACQRPGEPCRSSLP